MHTRNGWALQAIVIGAFFYPILCISATCGTTLSLPLIAREPSPVNGYQVLLDYDPVYPEWHRLKVYFDGGFSHLTTNTANYTTINIYSLSPVVRYTFLCHGIMRPYFELSIGLSYLNHTRFDHKNLGIHMSFQDRAGIGAFLGISERFSLGIHALHYSNASLSSHNSGISIPLVLDIGYRF